MYIFRHETHDLEEGANRILTQVLTPRTLSIFEPKISMAVNEFLGIANEAIPNEINGMSFSYYVWILLHYDSIVLFLKIRFFIK